MAKLLFKSRCEPRNNLAYFYFSAQPGINRSLITVLATCASVSRHESIQLCGPTGVGKSHLANDLAIEAIKRSLWVIGYYQQLTIPEGKGVFEIVAEEVEFLRNNEWEVGYDVGSKSTIWVKVNPDFEVLVRLIDGLRADNWRR